MYPLQSPTTGLGSLQQDVFRIERELHQKANSYEISTLTHDVIRLASAIGQLSTVVDGLLTRLQEVEEKVSRIVQET